MYTTEFIRNIELKELDSSINIKELKFDLANYTFTDGTSGIELLQDDMDDNGNFNNTNTISVKILINKIKDKENKEEITEDNNKPWIMK